jgi:hypothetical protein
VTVVTEDVLGPMRNSLYIELVDGSRVSLDEQSEMVAFVAQLQKEYSIIAAAIRRVIATVGEQCSEQTFDLKDQSKEKY